MRIEEQARAKSSEAMESERTGTDRLGLLLVAIGHTSVAGLRTSDAQIFFPVFSHHIRQFKYNMHTTVSMPTSYKYVHSSHSLPGNLCINI